METLTIMRRLKLGIRVINLILLFFTITPVFGQNSILIKPVGFCPKWLTSSLGKDSLSETILPTNFDEEVYTEFQLSNSEVKMLDSLLCSTYLIIDADDVQTKYYDPLAQNYGNSERGSFVIFFLNSDKITHAFYFKNLEGKKLVEDLSKNKAINESSNFRPFIFKLQLDVELCVFD